MPSISLSIAVVTLPLDMSKPDSLLVHTGPLASLHRCNRELRILLHAGHARLAALSRGRR